MFKNIFFFIPFILTLTSGLAREFRVTYFNQEKGLQNELVKDLAVDHYGNIWLGTDYGLIRYNGKDFIDFSRLLPHGYIKGIYAGKGNQLYVTYDRGFAEINYDENGASATIIAEGGLRQGESVIWYPKSLYEDNRGNIWFSDNVSVHRFSANHLASYFLGEKNIPQSYVRSFTFFQIDTASVYMVSQQGYFYRYNPSIDKVIEIETDVELKNISSVIVLSPDRILVGCDMGLVELTVVDRRKIIFSRLINPIINASYIFRLNQKELLIGTWANGLWYATCNGTDFYLEQVEEFFPNTAINRIMEYRGNLILATDIGFAILSKNLFRQVRDEELRGYIYSIKYDSLNHYLLVSMREKVLKLHPENFSTEILYRTTGRNILCALTEADGLWISDNKANLQKISGGKAVRSYNFSQYGSSIHQIIKDPQGNIWVVLNDFQGVICIDPAGKVRVFGSTEGIVSKIKVAYYHPGTGLYLGGSDSTAFVYRYNPSKESFDNLSYPLNFPISLNLTVNDLKIDRKGTLWLATSAGLLKIQDHHTERVKLGRLTGEDIRALAIDSKGQIWFALSDGLCTLFDDNLLMFNHLDGLPSKNISYRALTITPDDRIFAGTLAGVGYNIEHLHPRITAIPRLIHITDRGMKIKSSRKNSFHNQTYLGFSFISPEHPTESILYHIQLNHHDTHEEWFTFQNEFFPGTLKIGHYQLIIRAKQKGDYLWSIPLIIDFNIHRIWYQRPLVWVFILITLSVLIFLIMRWNNRRLIVEKNKLNRLVSERTRELEAKTKEIEAKNQMLLLAKEEAERSSRAKAEFLSMMSHEIRTPMHGVIGMIDLLLMNNPPPSQTEQLNILKFSATNLMMLLDDILDFNKIDSGKLTLNISPFDLKSTVRNIIADFSYQARQKGLIFSYSLDDSIPDTLLGDSVRLSQILVNLIGNAVKFTDKGEIAVEIKKITETPEKVEVYFAIKDTGIGIPENKLKEIFEVFSQVHGSAGRRHQGTGLGLAITKKLLELMNSSINVESQIGVGSKFSFSIQFSKINVQNTDTIPPPDERAIVKQTQVPSAESEDMSSLRSLSLKGIKILLVEDNSINIKVVTQMLKYWEAETEVATTGAEAISIFEKGNFDLILMDLHLPGMDGYQTASLIRDMNPHIPILALTAAVTVEEKEKALSAGMNDFIAKPFRPQHFYDKISRAVKHKFRQPDEQPAE